MKSYSSITKFLLFQTLMFLITSASAQTLKIMPMGDSNTEGAGRFPGARGSWRAPLYTFLKDGGYDFDFVGGKTTEGDICPDPNHWGKGGWQISDVPAIIHGRNYISIQGENRSGLYDEMSDAISMDYFSTDTINTRNIILLQIGVNDILHQVADSEYAKFNSDKGTDGQGDGQEWVAEGMIARLNALLQRIDSLAAARNLRIDVMLATLCRPTKQWKGDAVSDVLLAEVKQYDAHISKVVPTMKFSNIRVKPVDQTGSTNGKLNDGVHPTLEGFIAMAKAWYNAITVTHSNVLYGTDKVRNRLDFWQAPGDGPRPLLVNIHGGGWSSGDKSIFFDYKPFIEKGISCASINYRLTPDNPLPVPVHDAARAIQFLRSKAAEWNIDPDRIALTGGSAGACTSMWLLLHDDLAKPNAKDPVSRQSTRVCAAAVYAGQTSIDPAVISEWIPSTVPMHNMIPYAVGQQSMENVWKDNRYKNKSYKKLYQEFSPINHLDANDPPLYMEYNREMKLPARSDGESIHHPMFGIKMWGKSNTTAKGHECHLRITSTNEYKTTTNTSYANGVEFLIDKLLAPVCVKKINSEAKIHVYLPKKDINTGAAVLICPGGGYNGLDIGGSEGRGIATWLNGHGITGIVLEYRLPKGRAEVPLRDAQRALRTTRFHAKEWGIDPDRLGIIGFSAGGHLASSAGTHFDEGDATSDDPIERLGCRPDFMVLVYPVILWSIPFTTRIGKLLNPGLNTIEIEVANLMANRIRQMDQQKVQWRIFHEINFVNYHYKPFDASTWELMDSGLLGPVTITPYILRS